MKRIVAGVIVGASLFLGSGSAGASTLSSCKAGNKAACKQYAYTICVAALKAHGFTTSAAQSAC